MFVMLSGNIVKTIFSGLAEASVGVLYGIIFGVIIWFLPHMKHVSVLSNNYYILSLSNSSHCNNNNNNNNNSISM